MKKLLLAIIGLLCILSNTNAQETNIISNSGFEMWNEEKPTDWATLATSNATIEQSADAHTGNYYTVVKGATSNKRLASKSYTLEAGTYTLSAFVKANGEEAGHYRLGYVKLKDGVVENTSSDYIYDNDAAVAAPAGWTEATFEFTLSEATELAVIVMNHKNGAGASFLIDDFTLTASDDSDSGNTDEPETPVEVSTIAEVLAAGEGDAAVKGTVIATYARGFLVNDGTGSILVYLGSDKGYAAGDVVTVSGATSMYGGLLQFGNTSTVEKNGTAAVSHPTPTTLTGEAMDAYIAAPELKYVEYTGTLTISGNYYNVAVEGANTAVGSIQYPQEGMVTAASGSMIKVTGYAIGVSSSKYLNTMAVKVEVIEDGEPETPVEVSTIAEVLAAGEGDATVKGTIIATYARGFLVNDGTGSILVYLGSDKGYAAGDVVTVSGATSMYGGLLQFGNTSTVEKSGTVAVSHPTPTTLTGEAMDAYIAAPELKYVEYTGTLTISGNYYNVAVEGANTAVGSIQYPQEGMVTAASGSVIKVTGYAIGVSSNKYLNTMAVKVEVAGEEVPEVPADTIVCNVTEALAAYVAGKQIPAVVTGYIVGAVNGAPETGSEFGTTEVATNILLSDNGDTNDYTECIIVQLPKGDIRSALNLVDNPGNYKKQIKINGSLETYFKFPGLKNPTEYSFTGVTGIECIRTEEDAADSIIFDLTGRRIESITKPGIYIVNGKKRLVK